jgi:hypothetical protein
MKRNNSKLSTGDRIVRHELTNELGELRNLIGAQQREIRTLTEALTAEREARIGAERTLHARITGLDAEFTNFSIWMCANRERVDQTHARLEREISKSLTARVVAGWRWLMRLLTPGPLEVVAMPVAAATIPNEALPTADMRREFYDPNQPAAVKVNLESEPATATLENIKS